MKKKDDPRHLARVKIIKVLFEKNFRQDMKIKNNPIAQDLLKNLKKIDKAIIQNAPAWPINQISPVELSILRLAVWELAFSQKREPYKVIVDEAVEIAKEFGSNSSAGFINGVLGTIIKTRLKMKES